MKTLRLLCLLLVVVCVAHAQVPNSGPLVTPAGGGTTLSATSVPQIINPTLPPYNAPLTQVCAYSALTVTNGSNQVSCSSATFTSADIGKVVWASCCGAQGAQNKASSVLILAQGVINSVVNATTVTVCTTTGSCTPVNATANASAGALMYWGFKATTQVQNALLAQYTSNPPCPVFYWVGMLLVDKGLGNVLPATSCQYPIGATGDTSLSIQGEGRANSMFIMSPDFDFTNGLGNSCGGGPSHTVCFFGVQGIERRNFGINGGGRSNTGNTTVVILDSLVDDFDWNVGLSDIGGQDTLMVCYQMDGSGAYPNFVEVDGCGAVPIKIASGTANTIVNGYAADVKSTNTASTAGCMVVMGGASVNTYGMYFGPANSAGAPNCITVNVGATWYSNGDICISGVGTNCINNTGGTIHLHNFSNPTDFSLTASRAIVSQTGSSALTYVTNSALFGSVNPVLVSAGAVYVDSLTTFAGGGTNSGLAATLTGTGACATITTQTGQPGQTSGSFKCTGTTGASTATITMPTSPGGNGYSCKAYNVTTTANVLIQNSTIATNCILGGTVNANDVIVWSATPY